MQAAKRRAVQELLFFASLGDMRRCQRIVRLWNLVVSLTRRNCVFSRLTGKLEVALLE